ncbi:MAG: dTDP-4-dehydrorhamnose reductase [Chloroflexi bacterium]|nr:dTDP-4-dehydrorhamnose reductase [Chloroflexota bacterium]
MRLFITGIKGQLGSELARQAMTAGMELDGGDLHEFDITNLAQTRAAIGAHRPDVVLHCAAFTDVDAAARQPDLAYRANGLGTQNVALACAEANAAMLYVSSNEVFDGAKNEPYREFDNTNPVNPYGYSKLAGEKFTALLLNRFYIVRTSWLTSKGGRNFVHRIQQLADENGGLKVVTDEVACPTFTPDLAAAILKLIATGSYGIYHLVNGGYCSRFDYAKHILELSGRRHVPVEPILLSDFSRPSTPPKFTPLANQAAAALGITLRPWQEALAEFLSV